MQRTHFDTMGTVASIATARPLGTEQAELEAICASYDGQFSLYRPDSELSRINRGELALVQASERMRACYEQAIDWRLATGGRFTPERPDGTLDLNGIVKALAIDECANWLLEAGHESGNVTIGGDSQSFGSADDKPWQVGIIDPQNRQAVLAAAQLGPGRWAVASSGSAERGDHIWSRPGVHPPQQVSVLAADIVTADVLATALIAGGRDYCDEVTDRWPVELLLVDADGQLLATPGWSEVHVEQ